VTLVRCGGNREGAGFSDEAISDGCSKVGCSTMSLEINRTSTKNK